MKNSTFCVVAGLVGAVVAGCRTADSNPPVPRPNAAYVDFYTDGNLGLSWEVKRAKEGSEEMQTVFSQYKPLESAVLRVMVPPGTHQLQVWFSNRVTEGPQTVTVETQEGKVTPVHVTLMAAGSASVDSQSSQYRASVRGGTRRVPRTTTEEQQVYRIMLEAESPRAYEPL